MITPLDEWKHLLDCFAIPLWGFDATTVPRKLGTGTLIHFAQKTILLTAEHITEEDRLAWAIQLRYDEIERRTQLHTVGPLNYLERVSSEGPSGIDLAYAFVPDTIQPRHQIIKDTGRIAHEDNRWVINTDLMDSPVLERRYGFAGSTKHFITHEGKFLGGDVQVETDLTFREVRGDRLVFALTKAHPGHVEYEGTSGGPIADENGTLVGIVVGGDEKTAEIYGLAVAGFRSALIAACHGAV